MTPPPAFVDRFDVAEIGKPERTPQGFLRAPAFLTRSGVFIYRRADGNVVREYRPAEEVFAPKSLATLRGAPVTDLHPTEMVSPANVRKLSIGTVGEDARRDGARVAASVTVQDGTVIAKVERGDRREVSMGYRCRLDATPGTFEGQPYDVVQRDIVYNHAALGPRNWGRAGSDVALRLDSDADRDDGDEQQQQVFRLDSSAALITTTSDAPPDRRADDDDEPAGGDMDQITIRVDGLDVQVPKQWAQVIEKALTTRDAQITQLTGARDTLQGKFDSVTAELATTKTKLEETADPKRLDAAVNARAALLEQAKRVLPPEFKFDGLTTRQIHEAVLTKLDDKLDLKTRSAEYVSARFDHAIETLPEDHQQSQRNDGLDQTRRTLQTRGNPPPPPPAQRQDGPQLPSWQQPLAMTKDARS